MENEVKEPAPKYNFITAEEYLEQERGAFEKHEYYQGEVFAMSGTSLEHVIIARNLTIAIGNKLQGKSCQPYGSGLCTHIPPNILYAYPDLSIICGKPELTDNHFDTATNPTVIIEILSPATRNYDMGIKFKLYRDIPTLKEYILIDSENMYVEKHTRQPDNTWLLSEIKNINEQLNIESVQISIALTAIYDGISF
ncbi:MAG: Uma2 family endonuclease [Rhizobacter sp.]|nr:Uma2 family endonuclease [Ferruginibacter sp.]